MAEPQLRLRAQNLDWQRIEDETVVLDVDASRYIAVNDAGSSIWAALVDGATRDELVSRLIGEFEVGSDQARADVDTFLERLRSHGLLEER